MRSTHSIEPDEIMAYLDGELPADRATAASEHLAECHGCQALAADLQGVSRKLLAWEVEEASVLDAPRVRVRPWRRWHVTAASLAVTVAGLAVLSFFVSSRLDRGRGISVDFAQTKAPHLDSFIGEPEPSPSNGSLIVRTAKITLISPEFDLKKGEIDAILRQNSGHFAQMSVGHGLSGERIFAASLRVPSDILDRVLAAFRQLGRVESESQTGEDVTRQVEDLDARLSNARITERRLTEILGQRAGKISEVLEVEKEIGRVRGEIERTDAERRNLANRVSYATIDLKLTEAVKEAESLWGDLRIAASEGWRNVESGVGGLAMVVLSYGPATLLWGAILFFPARFAWRRWKR